MIAHSKTHLLSVLGEARGGRATPAVRPPAPDAGGGEGIVAWA